MDLFKSARFTSHSGIALNWKIECDALTNGDIATIANEAFLKLPLFRKVVGVPEGGLRIASAIGDLLSDDRANNRNLPTLVVDDVLTTGSSIKEEMAKHKGDVIGFVIFSRIKELPPMTSAMFILSI